MFGRGVPQAGSRHFRQRNACVFVMLCLSVTCRSTMTSTGGLRLRAKIALLSGHEDAVHANTTRGFAPVFHGLLTSGTALL
jgi:hypothetical protein